MVPCVPPYVPPLAGSSYSSILCGVERLEKGVVVELRCLGANISRVVYRISKLTVAIEIRCEPNRA